VAQNSPQQSFLYNGPDYNTFVNGVATLTFDPVSDPHVVVSQLGVRAWLCEQGALDDPNVGAGLRKYVLASMSSQQQEILRANLRTQALAVDGVQDCSLSLTSTPAPGGILLTITAVLTAVVKTGAQTFTTVFALSPTTSQLIVAGQVI
jgi:hypothetical protein